MYFSHLPAFNLYSTAGWLLKQLRNHKCFVDLCRKLKNNIYLCNAKDSDVSTAKADQKQGVNNYHFWKWPE